MDDIQAQMNSILENPDMMDKIKSLAENLNIDFSKNTDPESTESVRTTPGIDMNMLQRITSFAKNSNIDKNQKSLLSALSPYLSPDRLLKLEKAMRASKMAGLATALFNNYGR